MRFWSGLEACFTTILNMGTIALNAQFRRSILDLQVALDSLQGAEAISLAMQKQHERRKRFRNVLLVAVVVGVALFVLLVWKYMV